MHTSFVRTLGTIAASSSSSVLTATVMSLVIAQQYIDHCTSSTDSIPSSSPVPQRDIPPIDTALLNHVSTIVTTDPFVPLPIVGGHEGILTNHQYILKPFTGIRGEAEANFYLQVWHPSRRHLPPAVFTPIFYGIYYHDRSHRQAFDTLIVPSSTPNNGNEGKNQGYLSQVLSEYITRYIMLEDLTRHYRCPSIMDIKMGIQTWDENASETKIRTEKNKYPIQTKIGFRFTGMRVWDQRLQMYREHGRDYGYALDDVTMTNAIAEYLYDGYNVRKDIIPMFVEKLQSIENYFHQQNEFRFYGSSLLFIYEGNPDGKEKNNVIVNGDGKDGNGEIISASRILPIEPKNKSSDRCLSPALPTTVPSTDVRMIDFAHVWPIRDGPSGRDTGYLLGLRNLLHYFEAVNYGAGKISGVSSLIRKSDKSKE